MANDMVASWKQTALATLATAKQLRNSDDHRSCVSRAYYSAYQAATAICIEHGDSADFPDGWNNPTHKQLPNLIANNGDLTLDTRIWIRKILCELRYLREIADYRIGMTVNEGSTLSALLVADSIFERLEIGYGDS